ncbi:LacI family DNA-binding transcriptional regulator [Streptomyces sp. DSM 42041]|uniref:LacI family DNA-binding transcriptional regulator n=1 Tax=Streptomyces hazeniae TaxID=3075538 RepID=A0ABU2NTU3_9ACTN|nr:LacI family DNA-binding transcriptional regulator [Streptomyces sp. DSM 42041]MDT0380031.1 LacI family DNA-binding transcriptional regulator [Streptomyces sp. DSM 42041]
MRRSPTIADVARAAGVSKGTVSFALNDRPGVAPATKARILAAAEELGFRPSHRARALSHSRAFALGLVMARPPELLGADPFFPAFIAGVETELAEAGYALLLRVVTGGWEEEAEGYRRLAADGRVDGVFLTDLRVGTDPRLKLLTDLRLPAVTLQLPDADSPFPAVTLDERSGVSAVVEHLAGLGHRRIAHVAGPQEFVHGSGRRTAFREAMASLGLPPGAEVVGDFTAAGGATATRGLLASPEAPTALVYANDLMAIAGITVAHERGLRIPEDLSVTGFDDTELAGHVHPPLTTVRVDALGMGRAAARLLLHHVEQPVGGTADHVALPPAELVPRRSTAPPPRTPGTPASPPPLSPPPAPTAPEPGSPA